MTVGDSTVGIVTGALSVLTGIFATHLRGAKSRDESAWRPISPLGRGIFIVGGILLVIAGLRARGPSNRGVNPTRSTQTAGGLRRLSQGDGRSWGRQ